MNLPASVRVVFVPALLFGLLCPALGGIRPSFSLDYCSWHATDIVLVEATLTPATFRVVESWKGDLEPGRTVTVAKLPTNCSCCGALRLSEAVRRNPERWSERRDSGVGCWLTDDSLLEKRSGSCWPSVGIRRFLRRNEDFCRLDRWRKTLPLPASDESWTKCSRALGHWTRQNQGTR